MNREGIIKAIKEAKEKSKKRNFTQTIELIIHLRDIDLRKPENRIIEELELPHGKGKPAKIALFADGELAVKAKDLVDRVITRSEMLEIAKNKRQIRKLAKSFDFFIAQADLMPIIGRHYGQFLGPRAKMPKVVPPNADIKPLVERLRKSVRIKVKDQPLVQIPIGSENMEEEKVADNIIHVLRYLEQKLERGLYHIESMYVKLTMGPAIEVRWK